MILNDLPENKIVNLAFEKATEWHRGQKYGEYDYVESHIKDVFYLVYEMVKDMPFGYRNLCLVVALLHDVLEDTDVKSSEITEIFGVPVCLAVECLTDAKGKNRRERKKRSYWRIRSNEVTSLVKVADRLANMTNSWQTDNDKSLFKMYAKEHDTFFAAIWTPYQPYQGWWEELDKLVSSAKV